MDLPLPGAHTHATMTAGTTPSWPDREPTRSSMQRRMDRWARWGMAALMLFTVSAIVAGWRYFPGFSGDHAWYLQVALRVSQGEVLYRDVAWAYGPLPAQALAALFRWLGPDAAWASLINAALTVTGVLLTYAVTRSVLSGIGAFLVTAFATLVGPNLWGDLFHIYFFTYTQAIAWGAVLSLAALAALHWQQTRKNSWLPRRVGHRPGHPEQTRFGLTALGASVVAIAAGRGPAGVWWRYLLTCGLTAGMGFGWQSSFAGWWPSGAATPATARWRSIGALLWGTYLGNKRLLLGGYVLWLAVAALWACRHWPRRRLVVFVLGAVASLVVVGVGLSYLLGGTASALSAVLRRGGVEPDILHTGQSLFLYRCLGRRSFLCCSVPAGSPAAVLCRQHGGLYGPTP